MEFNQMDKIKKQQEKLDLLEQINNKINKNQAQWELLAQKIKQLRTNGYTKEDLLQIFSSKYFNEKDLKTNDKLFYKIFIALSKYASDCIQNKIYSEKKNDRQIELKGEKIIHKNKKIDKNKVNLQNGIQFSTVNKKNLKFNKKFFGKTQQNFRSANNNINNQTQRKRKVLKLNLISSTSETDSDSKSASEEEQKNSDQNIALQKSQSDLISLEATQIFGNFKDCSSEYQLQKLKLFNENLKTLFKNNKYEQIEVRGFYGEKNIIAKKLYYYFGRRVVLIELQQDQQIIQAILYQNKLALILIISEKLYSQPIRQDTMIVDLLKYLQDACCQLQICINKSFNINKSQTPFYIEQADFISTMQQEQVQQYKTYLRKLSIINSQEQQNINNHNNILVYFQNYIINFSSEIQIQQVQKQLLFEYESKEVYVGNKTKQILLNFDELEKYMIENVDDIFFKMNFNDFAVYICQKIQYFIAEENLQTFEQKINQYINGINTNLNVNLSGQHSLNPNIKEQNIQEKIQQKQAYFKSNDFKIHFIQQVFQFIREQNLQKIQTKMYQNSIEFKFYSIQFFQDSQNQTNEFCIKATDKKGVIKQIQTQQKKKQISQIFFLQNDKGVLVLKEQETQNQIEVHKFITQYKDIQTQILFKQEYDTKIVCNYRQSCLVMYNNRLKLVKMQHFNNLLEIKKEDEFSIYEKIISKFEIQNIKSMIYYSILNLLLFINQDDIVFSFNVKNKKIQTIKLLQNDENQYQIQSTYDHIVLTQVEEYLLLKNSRVVDIYNMTFYKLKTIVLNSLETYKTIQLIQNQSNFYIILQTQTNLIDIYEIPNNNTNKQYEEQDNQKNKKLVIGNSFLDYIQKSFIKYNNKVPSQSNQINSLIIDKNRKQQISQYIDQYEQKSFVLSTELKSQAMKTFDLEFILKTRVPIHIVSFEQEKLTPLKNGQNNYENLIKILQQNLNKQQLVEQLCKQINFGAYEEMQNQKFDQIKIISVMGRQSTGKSYLLNRLFGTRFNVDSNRCTDGLWMSMYFDTLQNKKTLYVIIDCEGMFNTKRTLVEETKLSLICVAISDLTIFSTNNNFDRIFKDFFIMMMDLKKMLKGKNLFKSNLLILVRDLERISMHNSLREFKDEIDNFLRSKNILLNRVFKRIDYYGIEHFKRKQFNQTINQIYKEIIVNKINGHYENFQSFLSDFKTVLCQVFLGDDQDMDQIQLKTILQQQYQKCLDYFQDDQEFYEKTGQYIEIENDQKEVKKVYQYELQFKKQAPKKNEINSIDYKQIQEFQQLTKFTNINDIKDNEELQQIQEDNEDHSLKSFQSQKQGINSEQHPLNQKGHKQLKQLFCQYFEYELQKHNQWSKNYSQFCKQIIQQRVKIILREFDKNLQYQDDFFNSIDKQRKQLKHDFQIFQEDHSMCLEQCRKCKRTCIKHLNHKGECDCFTEHKCLEKCKIQQCQQNNYQCFKFYGHQDDHYCNQSNHICRQECAVNNCSNQCNLKIEHSEDKEHTCQQRHLCNEICQLDSCGRQCNIALEQEHDIHKCSQKSCLEKCQHCDKKCIFDDHFHSYYIENEMYEKLEFQSEDVNQVLNFHTCGDQHYCQEKCENEGLCELRYTFEKRAELTDQNGLITFDYIIPNEERKNCSILIPKFQQQHQEEHDCGKNDEHTCTEKCPQCFTYCKKQNGHDDLHENTQHRNKDNNIYLLPEDKQEVEFENENNRKYIFKPGDTTQHEHCAQSCLKNGRGHFHLVECENSENCLEKMYKKHAKHCNKVFKPDIEKRYDMVLCSFYFENNNWKAPILEHQQEEIDSCNFYCGNQEHDEENREYCYLDAWHDEEHEVECNHDEYKDIQIAFLLDTTGSMDQYLLQTIEAIKQIILQFEETYQKENRLYFAFVGYKDHKQEDVDNDKIDYPVEVQDFTEGDECIQFIEQIEADGGEDCCEAVVDGYQAITDLSWKDKTLKFVFHIADAPPHGEIYHHNQLDNFKEGCPCKKEFSFIIGEMIERNIQFYMIKLRDILNQFVTYMQQNYGKNFQCADNEENLNIDAQIQKQLFLQLENFNYDVKDPFK